MSESTFWWVFGGLCGLVVFAVVLVGPWYVCHQICISERKTNDPFWLCGAPYSQAEAK